MVGSFGESEEARRSPQEQLRSETLGIHPDYGNPAPESFLAELSAEAQDEIHTWRAIVNLHTGVLYDRLSNSAQRYILTVAANDSLSLINHVDHLDGRSAATSARMLLEHLVNFHDVTSSQDNTAERFLGHRHVAGEQLSRRRWHIDHLGKKAAKKESNRLDGLGNRSRRALKTLHKTYGGRFKFQWATGNLETRSTRYGLTQEYEGYRILSSIIHGSSGGMKGLVKELQQGQIHRIGKDVQLVPFAFEEGLRNFVQLCRVLQDVTNSVEADELEQQSYWVVTQRLQEVREVASKWDRKMWPKNSPLPPYIPSVVIWQSGKHKWAVHDVRTEMMIWAEPLGEPPDLTAAKQQVKAEGIPSRIYQLPGTRLQPARGAQWAPAEAVHATFGGE